MTSRPLTAQRISAVFLALIVLTGCPRVLYLDYHPSAAIMGSGPVRIETFAYAGHPTGLMKQKEVESGDHASERLFLSQDIGEFFATALRKELISAGYEARDDSTRAISGTIDQFFLDYVGGQDQRF